MVASSLSMLAAVGYGLSSGRLWCLRARGYLQAYSRTMVLVLCAAILAQAVSLHAFIDTPQGQNLSVANVMSMTAMLGAIIVLLGSARLGIASLGVLMFPFAAVMSVIAGVARGQHYVDASTAHEFVHVWLSLLLMSILLLATLQAIALAMQEYRLRHHAAMNTLTGLPPLQTMETLLFQLLAVAFGLLSVLLLTSLIFFRPLQGVVVGKLVFTSFAWGVFGLLLVGRYRLGLRGLIAIWGAVFGLVAVMIAYTLTMMWFA